MVVRQTPDEKRKAALAAWEKTKYYNVKTKKGNTGKKKDEMKETDE